MKRYVIWDSDAVDKEFVRGERAEMEFAEETNQEYLNDTKLDLSGVEFPKEIIIFAELDLWNGRKQAYCRTHTNRVSEVLKTGYLRGQSNIEYWVDAYGNLRAEESHHDGTNKYLFRIFKDSVSVGTETFVLNKWERGAGTKDDITRYTHRIGKEIADIYGWKVRK